MGTLTERHESEKTRWPRSGASSLKCVFLVTMVACVPLAICLPLLLSNISSSKSVEDCSLSLISRYFLMTTACTTRVWHPLLLFLVNSVDKYDSISFH